MNNRKDTKKKKVEKCIDCGEKTTDFYISSINKGKIIRCSNCHEFSIIRSSRYDARINEETVKE